MNWIEQTLNNLMLFNKTKYQEKYRFLFTFFILLASVDHDRTRKEDYWIGGCRRGIDMKSREVEKYLKLLLFKSKINLKICIFFNFKFNFSFRIKP